jgi:ankyrin repeat protein
MNINKAHDAKEVVDTVSKACAYGDFDKVKTFVDLDPGCINVPDENGYYPLQWAALNNRLAETNFLIAQGVSLNVTDGTGQTALHWAAVRGSLPVIETLLRNSADYGIKDIRGYTAIHVASQYGQTAVLYHMALKWGVDMDQPDHDGRTPLHWAAYKGYADTIRLLLVLDSRFDVADKEGCTPLHWAAIKGNGEACTVLLQGGSVSVLTYKDATGLTPAQLALEKGHRYLGLHLAEYKKKQEGGSWFGKNGKLSWMVSTQLAPLIVFYVTAMVVIFLQKVMPAHGMGPILSFFSWSVVVSSALGFVFLYKTTTADPGFIPRGWDTYNSKRKDKDTSNKEVDEESRIEGAVGGKGQHLLGHQHKALDSPALWAGNWNQLCVSCRIVRPLRAKHCSVTDRCIELFDHFCPWVGNAIGKGNRHYFLALLWLNLYAAIASSIIGVIQIQRFVHEDRLHPSIMVWLVSWLVINVFVAMGLAGLSIAQAAQVARNVTTNELANWHRYPYLQASDGSFHNPFNKDCTSNCVEACTPFTVPMAPVYIPKNAGSRISCKSEASCHRCH